MPDVLYFNGRFTDTSERVLGVEDRGFQFGDSVYEVFKFTGRRPIFLDDHFVRLRRGLEELEIRCPWTKESFATTMRELLDRTACDDGIVYIQVSRGEAPRAHFWPDHNEPTAVAYSRSFKFPDAIRKERGIKVITTRDIRWSACHVKSTNLLGNAIAKKEAQRAGADEAIFLAYDDRTVREGASSSFFAVRSGRLVTHPLDEHILPGVVRDRLIGLALAAKIRVDERPLREAELFDLDEAFITSTTQGVMPVTEIDARVIGNNRRGEVTTQLQRLFDALEQRETADR
ncbi:MAG TPA: aminotransferase class IV [Thermoanaerobaculia bacterium]|nr:aminotransferase class IV [Thermoanaerobaculia bacterium]